MTVPNIALHEGTQFPEMTMISNEQWDDETGYVADRLAPVTPSARQFRRITVWPLEELLQPLKNRLRARNDVGPLLGATKPDYRDFYVDQGQLRFELSQEELNDAANDGNPDRPWMTRTRLATSGLRLSVELGVKPFFTPGTSEFTGAGAIGVASPKNWEIDAEPQIGKAIKGLANDFLLEFKRPPNYFLIDKGSDTWFLERLAEERKVVVQVGSMQQTADLLPSADGVEIAGMTGIVPGARKNTSTSAFDPAWVWSDYPYFAVGYSPTLGGQEWNETGDAYIFQPEFRPPGREVGLEVKRMQDPMFPMNGKWHGWIDFNRSIEVHKPMLMVLTGIR